MSRARELSQVINATGNINTNLIGSGAISASQLSGLSNVATSGNYSDLNVDESPINIYRLSNNLWSSITTASSAYYYGNYDLGSWVNNQTLAVICSVKYIHNGRNDHGYLTGWLGQYGIAENDGSKRGFFTENHFDWYYNVVEREIWIPWDGGGDSRIRFYIEAAHNSNTQNRYDILIKGVVSR